MRDCLLVCSLSRRWIARQEAGMTSLDVSRDTWCPFTALCLMTTCLTGYSRWSLSVTSATSEISLLKYSRCLLGWYQSPAYSATPQRYACRTTCVHYLSLSFIGYLVCTGWRLPSGLHSSNQSSCTSVYWRALSGGRCRGSSATPFQFILIIDCH